MALIVASEHPMRSTSRQMNKILDQLQKGYYNFCPSETWTPNVNLYENDTAYVVCVDLAGVEKEKIDLVVEDQTLTLKGTRAVPTPEDIDPATQQPRRLRIHMMEIDHGAFVRQVELPDDVQRENITASHRNGLLWIELPKIQSDSAG